MTNCKVTITDSNLVQILNRNQFNNFEDFLNAFTQAFENPLEFDMNGTTYTSSHIYNQVSIKVYNLKTKDPDTGNLIEHKFTDIEYLLDFLINQEGNLYKFHQKIKSDIETNLKLADDFLKGDLTNPLEVSEILELLKKLRDQLYQINLLEGALAAEKITDLVKKYNEHLDKETVYSPNIIVPEINYIYPTTNFYDEDKKAQKFVFNKDPLNVARSKVGISIAQYQEENPDHEVYISLRQDVLDNTQTGPVGQDKMGVIGELYVKINSQFQRLYVLENSVVADVNTPIRFTTNINKAQALGHNNSKSFTVIVPDFSNRKYTDRINPIRKEVVQDFQTLRELVLKGDAPKYYRVQSPVRAIPLFRHTVQSRRGGGQKLSQTVRQFLRGRSINDVEFIIITQANIDKFKDPKYELGDVLIKLDGQTIPVFNKLFDKPLRNEVLGLLNHQYRDAEQADQVLDYLNSIFSFESETTSSLIKFERRDNRIIMSSRYERIDNNGDVTFKKLPDYKEVNINNADDYLDRAYFNIDKVLIKPGALINKFSIVEGELVEDTILIKDLYIDNLSTIHEQVEVDGKFTLTPRYHAVFNFSQSERSSNTEVEFPPADATGSLPKTVKEYFESTLITDKTREIVSILQYMSEALNNQTLNKRLDTLQFVIDPTGNYSAVYDAEHNIIRIGNQLDPNDLEVAITHELIHAFVSPWIENNPNHPIVQRLNEIKETIQGEDSDFSIHEMLAKLSDHNYRRKLNKPDTIINELLQLLTDLFNAIFSGKNDDSVDIPPVKWKPEGIPQTTYTRLVGEMIAIVKAEIQPPTAKQRKGKSKTLFNLEGEGGAKTYANDKALKQSYEDERTADIVKFENFMLTLDSFTAQVIIAGNKTIKFLNGDITLGEIFNDIQLNVIDFKNDTEIDIDEITNLLSNATDDGIKESLKNDLKILNARLEFIDTIINEPDKIKYYLSKYSKFIKTTKKIRPADTGLDVTVEPTDTYTEEDIGSFEDKEANEAFNLQEDTVTDEDADSVDSVTDTGSLEESMKNTGNDNVFERSGVEKSSLQSADKEVLSFIKLNTFQFKADAFSEKRLTLLTNTFDTKGKVIRETDDGEPLGYEFEFDSNGFPKFVNTYTLWNTLQRIVAGSNNFDEMLEKMTYEMGEYYGHPEIGFLGDRIRRMIDEAEGDPKRKEQVTKFITRMYRSLSRYATPMMTVINIEGKSYATMVQAADIKRPAMNVIMMRLSESYDRAKAEGFIKDNAIDAAKIVQEYEKGNEGRKKQILHIIGMRVPEIIENNDLFRTFTNELINVLKIEAQKKQRSANTEMPLNYIEYLLEQEYSNFTGLWYSFISMWDYQRPFFKGQMRKNAEDELQSDYSIGAAILKDISYMNSSRNDIDLATKIPRLGQKNEQGKVELNAYAKSSLIINKKAYRSIGVYNYNGYQKIVEGKSRGKKSINLNPPEYLIQSIVSFYKNGVMENIRAQVATTSLALNIHWDRLTKQGVATFPFDTKLVNQMFSNLANPKLATPKIPSVILAQVLRYLRADLLTHGKPVHTSEIFGSSVVNPIQVIENITGYINGLKADEKFDDAHFAPIKPLYDQVVTFFIDEAKSAQQLFENENVYNALQKDNNFIKYLSDLGFDNVYEAVEAFSFYSWIYKVEEVILFHGDLEQIGKFYKRANSPQSTGTMLDTSVGTLDVAKQMLENNSFGSLYGSPLRIDKEFDSAVLPDDIQAIAEVEESKASIIESLQMYNKKMGLSMTPQQETEFLSYYDAYQNSNISDGGAYIHPDAYKVFMMMVGADTRDFDLIYEANYLMEKKEKTEQLTESENKRLDDLLAYIYSGDVQLPVLKFSYRGPGTQTGQHLEVFDKFALTPLFPSLFPENSRGRKMLQFMTKNNLAYVKFASGTKLKGLSPVVGNISQFNELLNNPNYEVTFDTKHTLKTEYLKEQIKTSSKVKYDNTLGVQFRELIISTIKDDTLANVWGDVLNKYIGSKQTDIIKQLGVQIGEDGVPRIDEKVLKANLGRILIEGVKSRDLPKPVLDFVEEYSKFKDKKSANRFFEASMNAGLLENIISSVINKMISVKVPGAMLVQIAPTFFGDDLNFYKTIQKETGFEVLRAQTKITLPKHMLGLLNIKEIVSDKSLDTREKRFKRLNELLKDSVFREKYAKQLTIVTYRIPTQDYNSMEVFEIVEFLPPWFGPHIVLPRGITTKSGTDFDYDKMSSLLPKLDKDGNIVEESLVNTMIDITSKHLLSPENFFRLIKPTVPDDVMREVKKVLNTLGIQYGEPTLGRIYNLNTWFGKWDATKMKGMLGIAATWNRLYSVLDNYNFQTNDKYITPYVSGFINYTAPSIKSFIDPLDPKGVQSSTMKVGNLDYYKWDILCQLINVTVDASSDDTFGYTLIDKNMFAMAVYMIVVKNIPLDIVLNFLHHPTVQMFERIKKQNLLNDSTMSNNQAKIEAFKEINGIRGKVTAYQMYNYLNRELTSLRSSEVMLNEMSEQYIDNIAEKDNKILAYYLHLMEETNRMFEQQEAIDMDKNYDSKMPRAVMRSMKITKAKSSNFADGSFIDRVLSNSTRSPFNIADKTRVIYKSMYPIMYGYQAQQVFDQSLLKKSESENPYVKNMDDESYYRAIVYDFLLSLVHTFNPEVRERALKYIADGPSSSLDKTMQFLQRTREVQDLIPEQRLRILNDVFVLGFQKIDRVYYYSPQFFTGFDNSTDDKNSLSDELTYMLKHPNSEVVEFAKDIIAMGMYQSGWRKSKFYFNDILPAHATSPIVSNAISMYLSLSLNVSDLNANQIDFVKKNKVEEKLYDGKPYAKAKDSEGKVTKWGGYKSKNGKSSMRAALDRDRTQFTVSPSKVSMLERLAKNQGITSGISGTLIWMEGQLDNAKDSKNVEGAWFRIISEPTTPNEKDFNAYENWESSVWKDKSKDFGISTEEEWKSIRFEIVDATKKSFLQEYALRFRNELKKQTSSFHRNLQIPSTAFEIGKVEQNVDMDLDLNVNTGEKVKPAKALTPEALAEESTPPTQPQAPVSSTNNPAKYTNHSGGAIGSDTQWHVIGKEFGMVNNKHYFTGEKGPKNAPLGNVDITNNPIVVEGASKVAQAAKQMWGYKYNTMKDQRLIRNWAQVVNSDAVFAIGILGKEGDIWKGDEKSTEPRKLLKVAVQGGTGYAVEMAIQAGKPVYVFDQVKNQWYKNINGAWSKSEVPILTKNFAGIGTREINELGKQAIRDVYTNTFKATTQPQASVIDGFQGYKGGFEDTGEGTPEGDGKDKAMREIADGFIGEIKNTNKSTSSNRSARTIAEKSNYSQPKDYANQKSGTYLKYNRDEYENDIEGTAIVLPLEFTIVMLARDSEYKGKQLDNKTKEKINEAKEKGAEFVVGDMPGVDSQFIDYLQEIGAKFTIYHTGDTPGIQIGVPAQASVTTTPPQPPPKGSNAKNINEVAPRLFNNTDKTLKVGSVVIYEGKRYLIYAINKNMASMRYIDGTKIQGSIKKMTVEGSYKVVEHTNRALYIVTDNKNIYSVSTGNEAYTSQDPSTINQRNLILAKAFQEFVNAESFAAEAKKKTKPGLARHPILDARKTSLEYSTGQAKALTEIGTLIDSNQSSIYVLAGYAGTGKTTIIENMVKYGQEQNKKVYVAAPTNKAVNVISDKLKASDARNNVQLKTLHGLLYGSVFIDPKTGKLTFAEKEESLSNSILVIDESSMIDAGVLKDLVTLIRRSDNLNIVFIGDRAQLLPVNDLTKLLEVAADPKFKQTFQNKYDIEIDGTIELTEVKRQGLESNVLKAATATRILNRPVTYNNEDNPEFGVDFKIGDIGVRYVEKVNGKDVEKVSNAEPLIKSYIKSVIDGLDSIYIVYTNKTRIHINNETRKAKYGLDPEPLYNDDKLISVVSSSYKINGDIFDVNKIEKPFVEYTVPVKVTDSRTKTLVDSTIVVHLGATLSKDKQLIPIILVPELPSASMQHSELMIRESPSVPSELEKAVATLIQSDSRFKENVPDGEKIKPVIATYAYAITGHKSQGSQWSRVYVDQEIPKFRRTTEDEIQNATNWHYTAITRATNEVYMATYPGFHMPLTQSEINQVIDDYMEEQEAINSNEDPDCTPNQTVI